MRGICFFSYLRLLYSILLFIFPYDREDSWLISKVFNIFLFFSGHFCVGFVKVYINFTHMPLLQLLHRSLWFPKCRIRNYFHLHRSFHPSPFLMVHYKIYRFELVEFCPPPYVLFDISYPVTNSLIRVVISCHLTCLGMAFSKYNRRHFFQSESWGTSLRNKVWKCSRCTHIFVR